MGDIKAALDEPHVASVLEVLANEISTAMTAVIDMPIRGVEDIFAREQLLGEIRGLRRFGVEIQDRRAELITQTQDESQGT